MRAGDLGELQYIDSVRINLGLVQQDVNVLWDLAAHDLSIMDHLVGHEAKSVVAFGEAHQGHDLADVAYLHIDYGDGLIASVHANWLSPVKIRHFLVGRQPEERPLQRARPLRAAQDLRPRRRLHARPGGQAQDPGRLPLG